jgi:hypothetical protein
MGKSASAPPPPDYSGAARETAAGNLEAARANTAANRVNQVTPYGNLNYSITGADPYGNPTYTATTSLAPEQQELLNAQNRTSLGLSNLADEGLSYVANMLKNPFDTSSLPSTGFDPAQTYQDAYMQRLRPQIEQGREALNVDLANRGIPIGSEAYKRAMLTQSQRENDLLASATTAGFNVGDIARKSALSEKAYLRNEPLNTLNAVRTGALVTGPTFVNPAMQPSTAGPDILGATSMGYNASLADSNARNAANNAMTSGLFSLGGAALMSDIRTKENIVQVAWLPNGLPVYTYDYKDEFKDHPLAGHGTHTGVMAHEVEAMYPNAVITLNNGYKAVDYGQL